MGGVLHNKIARKVFTEALLGGMERREAHSPSSKSSQMYKETKADTIQTDLL